MDDEDEIEDGDNPALGDRLLKTLSILICGNRVALPDSFDQSAEITRSIEVLTYSSIIRIEAGFDV